MYRFVLNGLTHANEILGEEIFRLEDWKVIGEYVYDHEGGRHQAFYSPVKDTVVMGELIKAHERIEVEQSLKYSQAETTRLWNQAGMSEIGKWMLGNEYGETTLYSFVQPQNGGQLPFSATRKHIDKPPPRFPSFF